MTYRPFLITLCAAGKTFSKPEGISAGNPEKCQQDRDTSIIPHCRIPIFQGTECGVGMFIWNPAWFPAHSTALGIRWSHLSGAPTTGSLRAGTGQD